MLGSEVQKVALRKLRMLDAATSLDDLRLPPGNRLEKLRGNRDTRTMSKSLTIIRRV